MMYRLSLVEMALRLRVDAPKERRTSFADADEEGNEEGASRLAICFHILGRWCIAPPWSRWLYA